MSHPPLDDTRPLSDPANCGQVPSVPGATPLRLRCPHCHNPLQLADDRTDEVLCPACGSSFRVPDARQTSTTSGTRQLGKFLLLERVGAGAFGAVWKARDTELDRTVALKIPHAGLMSGPDDRERFQREARAAAQLRHPGIVAVHEVATLDDGLPALVADFVEGVTLRDYLQQRRLTFRESAELLTEVAEAVHYAHERGLVHRDLKPGNLMLEFAASLLPSPPRGRGVGGEGAPLPRPLVMDFGLALRPETDITLTVEGQVIGTPAYMSPEQARGQGHTVDRRSDVYSLGVILYELLTGELPFRGSKQMILHEVLHEEPPAPRRLNDKVPRDLETICLKCLEKEPGRRYATAQALADDLRRWLKGEPIVARPAGAAERAWKWAKRRPAAAGLLAAGLLATMALVGLAVALAYQGRLEEAHRGEQEQRKAAEAFGIEADNQRKVAVDALGKAEVSAREADQQRGRAERSEALVRRLLYLSEMNLAKRCWDEANVSQMLELLEKYRPGPGKEEDLRGFEWHYLWRLCHSDLPTLQGHNGPVRSVACSPDGKRIATGSHDGTVKIWNAATGREERTLEGHTGPVWSVAFSPDGKRIASGSLDHKVKLWDAATGEEALTLKEVGPVGKVAFSPDGKRIAAGTSDGTLGLWDTTTGQVVRDLGKHGGWVLGVAFSPDGQRLASSGSLETTVKLWDAATGRRIFTLKGHAGHVSTVVFSPDGKRLVSGDVDGMVKLWDTTTGRETTALRGRGHAGPVSTVAFSPDGQRLASGSKDNSVKVWDAVAGQERFTLNGHTGPVWSVAFSPDGQRIISGSEDKSAKVWDAIAEPEVRTLRGHDQPVPTVAFSPGGQWIASGHFDGTVKLWDASTGREVRTLRGNGGSIFGVAFSPDGKRIISVSQFGEVKAWDAATGQEAFTLKEAPFLYRLAVSTDGQRMATGRMHMAELRDAATGRTVRVLKGHAEMVHSVAFNPDGRRLATGSQDNTVILWDTATGQIVRTLKGHAGRVNGVAFSPDGGRLVSGGQDCKVILWDAVNGQQVRTDTGHARPVSCVAFSPDGKRIVSGSEDRTVKLWDAATGQEVLVFKESARVESARVSSVAFSPDGRRLAAGNADGTVRVWDATPPSGKPAAPK